MSIASHALIGLLVLFSLRRLLWVLVSWLPPRPSTGAHGLPGVLVAVAFRNEEDSLPRLLSSLDALNYDAGRFSVCPVDDASADASTELAATWAHGRVHARLIILHQHVGKAEALNRALAATGLGREVVVVYDSDECPRRDSLRRLVAPFADPGVEAVGGYRRPVFRRPTGVAAYACLEAWTHQLVNLAAKDFLGLNPPTSGGNCAYRRSALERIGGFPKGSLSEDTEMSLALVGSGGKTRFIRAAVSEGEVAASLQDYLSQRVRWSLGLLGSRRHVRGLEAGFVAAGYLDRVVLLLVLTCVAGGSVSPLWILAYAAPALLGVVSAAVKARPEWWFACMVFAVIPVMFVLDVLISVVATVHAMTRRWIPGSDRRSAGGPEPQGHGR